MPISDFIAFVDGQPCFCFEGSGEEFLVYARENLQDFFNEDPQDLEEDAEDLEHPEEDMDSQDPEICNMVEFSNLTFDDEDFRQLGSYLQKTDITAIAFNHNCTFRTHNFYDFLNLATSNKEEILLSFTGEDGNLAKGHKFITSANQLREIFLFTVDNPEKEIALMEGSRSIVISNLNLFITNVLEMIDELFEIDPLESPALFSRFFPDRFIRNIDCSIDEYSAVEEARKFVEKIIERERQNLPPCSIASRKRSRDDEEEGPPGIKLTGQAEKGLEV